MGKAQPDFVDTNWFVCGAVRGGKYNRDFNLGILFLEWLLGCKLYMQSDLDGGWTLFWLGRGVITGKTDWNEDMSLNFVCWYYKGPGKGVSAVPLRIQCLRAGSTGQLRSCFESAV